MRWMTDTAAPAVLPDTSTAALPRQACGLPDFAATTAASLRDAALAEMARQREAWEAIATSAEPPSTTNTLEALERAGTALEQVMVVLYTRANSAATDELREVESELSSLLAVHRDALLLDERIFARLTALADTDLDAETAWLLHRYRTDFERAGIRLGAEDKERLRGLNTRISSLQTAFSQTGAQAMEAAAVHVTDPARLAGLDEGTVAGLRQAAADAGLEGWLVPLRLPTAQPVVSEGTDAELRERVHRASVTRGSGADPATDTRAILLELVRLRAERATLLGHPHHASYVAGGATARTAEAIAERLERLAGPAARNARAEAAELQAELESEQPGATLHAWDWGLLAERVRREKFAFDSGELRPYLELDSVLQRGVFVAAERLYGLRFTERPEIRGYAEGVRTFEVTGPAGELRGYVVADYFAREGKRGGAWMHSLVKGSGLLGGLPVVVNNLNVTRPPQGEPALLTWDEVRTAFHEFGHALHGLLSRVRYPTLAGTAVPRDFVEYPSQVNEMWAVHPEVLASYARHHVTGEPMPQRLLDAVHASEAEGEGFRTTEYLAAAVLDQAWHRLTPAEVPDDVDDVERFEAAALAAAGLDLEQVPPRYRTTYFNHAFGGGYDAGYYAYIWSEVLDADTVEWFRTDAARDGDGGLNRDAGDRFADALLSRGHSRDPLESYRDLRGRDADIQPLLVRRGLA